MPIIHLKSGRIFMLAGVIAAGGAGLAHAERDVRNVNFPVDQHALVEPAPVQAVPTKVSAKQALQRSASRYTCTPSGFGQKARCYIGN